MVRNVKIVEIIRTNIKPKIAIVSETQTFNNLTSAERSGAQCEVEAHCGGRRANGTHSQIISELKEIACRRHAVRDVPLSHPKSHWGY